jgi:hypothetical protein
MGLLPGRMPAVASASRCGLSAALHAGDGGLGLLDGGVHLGGEPLRRSLSSFVERVDLGVGRGRRARGARPGADEELQRDAHVSLPSQGDDGVEGGGAAGGQDAEHDAHGDAEPQCRCATSCQESTWAQPILAATKYRKPGCRAPRRGPAPTKDNTRASARNCVRMAARRRTDGRADADLLRALADADEQDVHDADAADEQRDQRDAGEQAPEQVRGG